jgi:proton-translocating NADH-quinone oxidoreductase chain M
MLTPLLDALILVTLATPLAGLLGQKKGHEKATVATYVSAAFTAGLIAIIFFCPEVLWGNVTLIAYGSSLPPEGATMEANSLSMYMSLVFLVIGLMASIFSVQELGGDSVTGYYTILSGMITAMLGIVSSGDLFTLFIFWEAMCICSYTLVAFYKEKWEAIEAGYKYFIMSSAGSITILFALSFLYGLTGTLNISQLSTSLMTAGNNPVAYISLLMLIVGFGLQAGMVPFHTWLPDAHMAAPSAVSAVLSGIMVKAGVFGLIKALMVIFAPFYDSWHITLAVFAVLTMFVGNLSALLQDDIKRLLAYSTIANVGYILLGLAIGSQAALAGSLFQVLNHAVVKALLFLCAGAFIEKAKTRSLKDLAGIRRHMPLTGTLFTVGALSMASFPSLNIFWSELAILTATWEAEMTWFSLLMVINLILSAAYCLRLIQIIAIKKETSTSKKAKEASNIMLVPIIALGFLVVLIGVYPGPFQALAEAAAQIVISPA